MFRLIVRSAQPTKVATVTKCVSLPSLARKWPGLVNVFCSPLAKKNIKYLVQLHSVRNKQTYAHAKSKGWFRKTSKGIKRNKKGNKYARLPSLAAWPGLVNVFCSPLAKKCVKKCKIYVLLGTNKQYAHAKSKEWFMKTSKRWRRKKEQKIARLPIWCELAHDRKCFCSDPASA